MKEREKILAIGRLYEFCSNKRFQLIKNEFIRDSIGQRALELNGEIKNLKGIDIFQATNDKDLLEYEKVLNTYTTNISLEYIGNKIIGDEVELYDLATFYPKEKMKSYSYDIALGLKIHLKKYSLSLLDITSISKSPDSVVYIDKFKAFFVTKRVKVKYKERVILLHFTEAGTDTAHPIMFKRDDGSMSFQNYSSIIKRKGDLSFDKLILRMALFYNANISEEILHNPVRLFIKGLDTYGADVKIDNNIKHFHYNVILPPHIDSPEKIYSISNNPNKNYMRMTFGIIPSPISSTVLFIYGINMDKMLKDFITGKI